MKFLLKCLFPLFMFGAAIYGKPSSVTYDERQTGDYNIRISVKDLKIVALLGDGLGALGDYDYNYDYSDMTVKPNESTTTTTTEKQNNQVTSNIGATGENVVEITPPPPHSGQAKPNPNITNDLKPQLAGSNQRPNSTVYYIPNASNLIAALQSPTIQTPINNVLANFSTIFNELIESGSLGFKNNSNSTNNPKPADEKIPVQVLVTPVEVHYLNDSSNGAGTTTSRPENSTVKRVRHGDCMEGYRKDKRGVCRPFARRPTQPSLLKKLIQLSRRIQAQGSSKENVNTQQALQ